MEKIKITASTLSPPQEQMMDYIKELNNYNIDYLHCDIMDGKFVPRVTYNHKTVKEIKKITKFPLDVHLMIVKPWRFIRKYIKAGADILTVHYEAFNNKKKLIKTLKKITFLGASSGVAINPDTSISELKDILPYCSMVILMSVHPGWSGKKLSEETYERLKELKAMVEDCSSETVIQIDCGINADNIKKLAELGMDIAVTGNVLYTAEDKVKMIKFLKE